jgi:hypothetical protein
VPLGESIAATATLLDSSGNLVETSEFSAPIGVGNTQLQVQLQVSSVTTTNLRKHHVNEGVSTINILFNEPMAPLAESKNFYSVETPKKVRVHRKIERKLVRVAFKARLTAANTVTLKLAKPSKKQLILIVQSGDPAANGQTLAASATFDIQ